MYNALKKKVYSLLHPELGHSNADRGINTFIIVLIILNVFAVMLETVESIHKPYEEFFKYFDLVSVIIFTIEYILRVWSCNVEEKYRPSITGRIKYMLSMGALIDLVAILPFYLHSLIKLDLRILRILRLLRFFRLFRLTAYMKATRLIVNVFKTARNELLLSLILAIFLIIISSSVIYFAEHEARPEEFTSIPATIWWSVTTLTTVGYGDMIPETIAGKIFTGIILMAGVALFALPAGIITAAFLEESRKQKKIKHLTCPHCGETINEHDLNH